MPKISIHTSDLRVKQYVFGALQQKHQTARCHNLEDHKADPNYPKRIAS
jgi:hypothetical protein